MPLGALRQRLARTHKALIGGLDSALGGPSRAEALEEVEEALITADVGIATVLEIIDGLKRGKSLDSDSVRAQLRSSIAGILKEVESPLLVPEVDSPFVIMVLGVNGVGKTTTVGKLARYFVDRRKTVLLAGADTFRAAAIEQLELWGAKTGCDVIRHASGGDPGAVAFDAVKSAAAKKTDVVLIDTAGRLHTKLNLMEELKKIKRVVSRELPGAPHENLLILDASTGQNAISQARLFNEAVGVTGLVVTKLDGTAKGGIIVPIARELKIPIRFVGVGEGDRDLTEFFARDFAEALV